MKNPIKWLRRKREHRRAIKLLSDVLDNRTLYFIHNEEKEKNNNEEKSKWCSIDCDNYIRSDFRPPRCKIESSMHGGLCTEHTSIKEAED
jgi:hypothetical protein